MSSLGILGATAPGLHAAAPPAPEKRRTAEQYLADPAHRAQTVCFALSKSGQLLNAAGMPAVVGSPEFSVCLAKARGVIDAGGTDADAGKAAMQAAMSGGGTNYLLYGIIGAVVLVGGAWYLTK